MSKLLKPLNPAATTSNLPLNVRNFIFIFRLFLLIARNNKRLAKSLTLLSSLRSLDINFALAGTDNFPLPSLFHSGALNFLQTNSLPFFALMVND